MQKTSYQTPELRDENDSIIQEGSFGKNTALSNATNDGWIDYVMNNLEALHDTIGDSAPTLDGNGHVVEPANLAIGDEDGLRIKNNYLKLSGGTVNGTLNIAQSLKMQDNQENVFGGLYVPGTTATTQYLQLYGGETPSSNGGNLQLLGNGQFTLQAKNGATAYNLVGGTDGTLKWRNNELAWKKDYLPLAGGTMTGNLNFNSKSIRFYSDADNVAESGWIGPVGEGIRITGGSFGFSAAGGRIELTSRNHATNPGRFQLIAADNNNEKVLEGKPDGTLRWGGNDIALAKNVLPLSGGTLTNQLTLSGTASNSKKLIFDNSEGGGSGGGIGAVGGGLRLASESFSQNDCGARIELVGRSATNEPGRFHLYAINSQTYKALVGKPDGTLTWNNNQLGLQGCTNTRVTLSSSKTSYTFTFGGEIVTIMAKRDSSYAMYLVDYWGAGAAKVVSGGNNLISVEHESGTRTVTITRDPTALAVPVQIIHSDIAW